MSTNILGLNCLLHDDEDPCQHAFRIDIDSSDIVGDLKRLIKAKALPSADFPTHELILWRVSIPHSDKNLAARLKEIRLDGSDSNVHWLSPALPLSSVFSDEHPFVDGNIHVLVQKPVSGARLECSSNKKTHVLLFTARKRPLSEDPDGDVKRQKLEVDRSACDKFGLTLELY